MKPIRALLVVCLALPAAGAPEPPALGSTQWIGKRHFQYAGQDAQQRDRWIYPHLDGVSEVLTVEGDRWRGSLGTVFDPRAGRFEACFEAGALLDRLLGKGVARAEREAAARRLALFVALHPTKDGPVYLRPARRALRRYLDDEGQAWVAAQRAAHAAALKPLKTVGTRVLKVPARLRSKDDHYKALVADGYLDVAIVGGNSESEAKDAYYSEPMAEELRAALVRQGFHGERQGNTIACSKTITMFGQQVRVRVRLTSAAHAEGQVRRSVANFVEGLAGADVVVYYGHSNKGSGYYLSETRSRFSRFKGDELGAADGGKLYRLGGRPHQLVVLNSCVSYARYCAPLRARCGEATPPGLLGTNDKSPTVDFAPRCAKLIALLTQGAGPTALTAQINAIRPSPKSPAMLLRGALQPRGSFVVPKGVTLGPLRERGRRAGFIVTAEGSDGVEYASTCVFPQDAPGQVVQVVPHGKGVHAVDRAGRLLEVSGRTVGAPEVVWAPKDPKEKLVFAVDARLRGVRRLHLLDAAGRLGRLTRKGDAVQALRHDPPPAGVRLVALGNGPEGRLVALDAKGRAYASRSRRWEAVAEPVAIAATPSLLRGATLVFAD